MLSWVRARASAVGSAALVAFVAASGAFVSHAGHEGGAPAAIVHDASVPGISAPAAPDTATDHHIDCLACSWVRSLRQRSIAAFVVAPSVEVGVRIVTRVFTARSPVRAAQPPLRSPPVTPVSA